MQDSNRAHLLCGNVMTIYIHSIRTSTQLYIKAQNSSIHKQSGNKENGDGSPFSCNSNVMKSDVRLSPIW